MAEEEIAAEIPQTLEKEEAAATDMDLENGGEKPEENGNDEDEDPMEVSDLAEKRSREGEEENVTEEGENGASKKQKSDTSVEEKRLEESKANEEKEGEVDEEGEEEEGKEVVKEADGPVKEVAPVNLGPKLFKSSVEMFDYFIKLLHYWPPNVDVNKYEYMVLTDLIKKGHPEPEKKIGDGIRAFQVRFHPMWQSRCFFVMREDGHADDFSFRKCVDKVIPLPPHMKANSNTDNGRRSGGGYGGGGYQRDGGGRGGGGGHRGRGGHFRGRGRGRRGGYRK